MSSMFCCSLLDLANYIGMLGLQALLHLSLQLFLVSMFLQPPENLSLFSQNFQHILTWEEPNDEPLIYYDVFYSEDLSFIPATNCSNITIRRCDLSRYFTDILAEYKTRVQSFTHNKRSNLTSSRFLNPLTDTVVGPPIVDVLACDGCIELSIRPPISYLWSEKEQRNVTMLSRNVFPKMDYMIDLVPSVKAPIVLKTISKENYTTQISSLLPNTNYCVSVTITGIMNSKQVASPRKCVITKGAQEKGDTSIYYFTVSAVIVAIGLLLFLYVLDKAGYISRKKTLTPSVLKSLSSANYLFNGTTESIPLGSLIIMETVRDIEVDGGHLLRAGVPENNSYIANFPSIRIMEQCMRNEVSMMEEELCIETSTLSMAGVLLQEDNNLEEEASNQAVNSLSITFTTDHREVGALSDINMGIPPETKETSTIDFNSLSIADPGNLWTCCRRRPELPDVPERSVGTLEFRHFSDVLILDESQESDVEDENGVEDMSCEDDCEEQSPSDYIRR
ncbi:interferon alpha/beta receptor 2-like isoform X2 [Engystomops pustulosus]|uniref:interferon alpha/beta receptor 2-like isoform X2 n=1 Tax=Engystomops pustulosus TaxID=76066 RepID=UPI003AFAA45C